MQPTRAADPATVAALTDMVVAYAAALDARDWDLMRSLFTDPAHIDYSSMGSIDQLIALDVWFRRLDTLRGFDATQHVVTNFRVELHGDAAVCTSYVNALHFLAEAGEDGVVHACGTYVHEFVLAAGGWKIRKAAFRLTGHQGGAASFQRAFAIARARAAAQQP